MSSRGFESFTPPPAAPIAPKAAPSVAAAVCPKCGHRVDMTVRSSRKSPCGRYRTQYLRCPLCGGKATRLIEIALAP